MKLKKLLCLLAPFMLAGITASANTYIFSFTLDGAGADPPNSLPGTAHGTLTLTDPTTLTLDVYYTGLTSDLTQVYLAWPLSGGGGSGMEFYAGDVPGTSGHWTDTVTDSFSAAYVMQGVETGHANLQLSTANYPFSSFGEIGGIVNPSPVPEPSASGLAIFAGAVGLTFWKLRKRSFAEI